MLQPNPAIMLALLFASFLYIGPVSADISEEDKKELDNFKYQTVTTPEGLTFRVPEDMPIEKRDGILAPIPFDEYMYGKFKQMEARMKSIESKIDNIEKMLVQLIKQQDEKKTLKG